MTDKFAGQTVVVIASGPSLCAQDVESVRGLTCIAVNTAWTMAPFCAVLFAGDNKWWCNYGDAVTIPAKRVSLSMASEIHHNAVRFKSKVAKQAGYNSGCIAIEYAICNGAGQVILLGFDCSVKNGFHFHGKHANSPNPNPAKCETWKRQFGTLRTLYPQADVINCSRYTELDVFPCRDLEEVLCGRGLTSAIPSKSATRHTHEDCRRSATP